MKTIGFVCEGPRDSDMLTAVISHILNENIQPLYLQPEASVTGENGNGWKGVWSWCFKNGDTLDQYMNGATPRIDMIIIHMDGDVSRKEREVHCSCHSEECNSCKIIFPLNCHLDNCPVVIPCDQHGTGVTGFVAHLQNLLQGYFTGNYVPTCLIPCDSTDSWIVAAYDDIEDAESIEDPWNSIISKKKMYHNIKVPGHRKSKSVYEKFIPTVCEKWDIVKRRCSQAAWFDEMIRSML